MSILQAVTGSITFILLPRNWLLAVSIANLVSFVQRRVVVLESLAHVVGVQDGDLSGPLQTATSHHL